MANILKISITPIDNTDLVVSLADAKQYLMIDFDVYDDNITNQIIAATKSLQEYTNLAFTPSNVEFIVEQNISYKREFYAGYTGYEGMIGNPFFPINDCGQKNYVIIPFANNAVLAEGSIYTLTGDRIYTDDKIVTVNYTSGDVPEEWMKQAVLLYVADLYENKGEIRNPLEVGQQAKSFCNGFISHGAFF